jgi:hypothetical protein
VEEEENEITGDCSLMIVIVTVITGRVLIMGLCEMEIIQGNLMRVTALVGLTAFGVGNPCFAASAETTTRVLEVSEHMFHESGLSWEMGGASMEIAWELGSRSYGALGLHCATGSYYSVLLTVHRMMEEKGICSGHLGNRRSDGSRIGVLLWAVSTGTWAHMAVLC